MFPSTWEGFGNPVIESIAARRACAAFPYPVLAEIQAAARRMNRLARQLFQGMITEELYAHLRGG